MKRILMFTATVIATFGMTACHQQKKAPEAVLNSFIEHFPNATEINWDQESKNEWEAEFTLDGVAYSATFDTDGVWLETEHTIDRSELPEIVATAIDDAYADYEIEETEMTETPAYLSAYEITIESGDKDVVLVIDANGKILKKEIENDDED